MNFFLSSRWSVRLALIIIALLALIALTSQWWLPYDPQAIDLPSRLLSPDAQHWLGTDHLGRDIFSRLMAATRVSLGSVMACLLLVHIGGWYSARLAYCTAHHTPPAQATHGLSPHMVRCCMGMLVVLIFSKYFYTACITNYFTFYLIEKFHVSVQTSQLCLFAYLAAFAIGTLVGGMLGDRYGRKYVILGSIFGSAPFALLLPYANLLWTMVLVVLVGLVISSAFSADRKSVV